MHTDRTIMLIDKPSGITSFDVIRRLRRTLGIKKIGHAGTLDPLATGLLIIGVGESTKELSTYMRLPKIYEVLIEFGMRSTTYDADGELEAGQLRPVTLDEFQTILKKFIGTIAQVPPLFSAIHVGGKRAYDLARIGKAVSLPPRIVEISSIEILEWQWPLIRLRVSCGKGTYIRSLAHDLGQATGCGALVKELRRIAIGPYRVEDAIVCT